MACLARRYRERVGRAPGFIPAGVYSAVRHYLKAIEAAKTDAPKTVIAKMRETPINDGFAKGGPFAGLTEPAES